MPALLAGPVTLMTPVMTRGGAGVPVPCCAVLCRAVLCRAVVMLWHAPFSHAVLCSFFLARLGPVPRPLMEVINAQSIDLFVHSSTE